METKLEYHTPILLEDLGMRFPTENSKRRYRYGLFKCFCGNEFETPISEVKSRKKKSCGCLNGGVTHGLSYHRLYYIWKQMMRRCTNLEEASYKHYGGRGITVCERWHSIENFIEDMFPTFEEGLSIDRIDVNGNYEPSNCRWANSTMQSRNTKLIWENNKSGYRGVSWAKRDNIWRAQITINNKAVHIGSFKTVIEGALAYNNYVIENNLEHPLNIIYLETEAENN